MKNQTITISPFHRWLSCVLVGIYYAYQMLHLTLGSTLGTELVRTLHFSVYQLSFFSSAYLYACAIGIIPAGLLLDRYPIKPLLLISLLITIAGTFLLVVSQEFYLMVAGRILTGISSDFAFLGYFTLANQYFRGKTEAFSKSLVYAMGAGGCILSQTPMTYAIQAYGWRHVIFALGWIGISILLLLYFIIDKKQRPSKKHVQKQNTVTALKSAIWNKQNLLCAGYACVTNLPFLMLGALWGRVYLVKVMHFSPLEASELNSLIFWGALLGAPLIGWLSGRYKQKRLMLGCAASALCAWLFFSIMPGSYWGYAGLFFIFGVLVNAQLFSILSVSEFSPKNIEATSISIVSIANNAGAAIYQVIFAWLMSAIPAITQDAVYSTATFRWIFLIVAGNYVLALLAATYIKTKNIRHGRVLGSARIFV